MISAKQLLALGLSREEIRYRVKVGRLRVVYRGVYAVGHDAIPIRGRLCAALLVAGAGAALSHGTAAYLRRLIPSMPQFIDITTTATRHRNQHDIVFHHAKQLEVTRVHGLPVTTPLRTLQDLAATQPRRVTERAVNEALVLKLATAHAMTTREGPGSAVLRAIAGDAAPTRSALERRFRRALTAAGLPQPVTDHRIGRYVADFYFPEHRLILETDGWGAHGHRLAFERDRVRDAELLARGLPVMRVTERMVAADLPATIERLGRVLSAARRRAS